MTAAGSVEPCVCGGDPAQWPGGYDEGEERQQAVGVGVGRLGSVGEVARAQQFAQEPWQRAVPIGSDDLVDRQGEGDDEGGGQREP